MSGVVAVDTSVAVPLLVASHPLNDRVLEWARDKELHLCGHALVETYSVLTRLPGTARVAPGEAVRLIDENFAEALTLPAETAQTVHRTLAGRGVWGGAAWDGLVALTALAHHAVLATRDARALATYDALGVGTVVLRDAA